MMSVRVLLIALLYVAAATGTGCCRGYKVLQFRRAGILPMYESSASCGSLYDQDDFCESPLYPADPMPKYDAAINRYYPPYLEPKAITHKCVCSKSIASQRMISGVPRFYKRGYCSEMDAVGSCGHYPCGQYGDCGQYGSCSSCPQYGSYGQHACTVPQPLYRQSAQRVLPLTLPASCIC